jgi:hypothetical protein
MTQLKTHEQGLRILKSPAESDQPTQTDVPQNAKAQILFVRDALEPGWKSWRAGAALRLSNTDQHERLFQNARIPPVTATALWRTMMPRF